MSKFELLRVDLGHSCCNVPCTELSEVGEVSKTVFTLFLRFQTVSRSWRCYEVSRLTTVSQGSTKDPSWCLWGWLSFSYCWLIVICLHRLSYLVVLHWLQFNPNIDCNWSATLSTNCGASKTTTYIDFEHWIYTTSYWKTTLLGANIYIGLYLGVTFGSPTSIHLVDSWCAPTSEWHYSFKTSRNRLIIAPHPSPAVLLW